LQLKQHFRSSVHRAFLDHLRDFQKLRTSVACAWLAERPSRKTQSKIIELSSEPGHFREIEITDFHGGHDHVEGLFAAGTNRTAHLLDIRQHMQQALVKPEV